MTSPAPQEAGAPPLVDQIAAAMLDLTYAGRQVSSAWSVALAEFAMPVVEAALASRSTEVFQLTVALEDARRQLASREAEVRRQVAGEIEAEIPERRGTSWDSLAHAARIARGES